MKKQLLLLVVMLLPIVTLADPVEIDGIYYNLIAKGTVAEVTYNPNGYSGNIIIPASVIYNGENYPVTSIGEDSFWDCRGLKSVTIPNSVTSIGFAAFKNCSGLTSITIPNSVTSIESYAFDGCTGLTSVYITDLEAWCKISFLKTYSSNTYSNPLSIAHHLYLNGEEIKDLVIPSSVTSIGEFAFYECTGLTSVTIPNNVTSIGNSAFTGCSGLTSVSIGNGVMSIGSWAFYQCSGLSSVTIPKSVTSLGSSVFGNCLGLTSVSIPNSVKTISTAVFSGCTGLTSITIPNSVSSIEGSAFANCTGLTSVTIGNGINSIASKAFASCPELADVYCYAENVPNTKSDTFKDSYAEYATLHIPSSSINAYQAAEPWKNFKSIVVLTDSDPKPTDIETVKNIEIKANSYFNLNGRRLNGEPTQKGVYIHNGKKVIVK